MNKVVFPVIEKNVPIPERKRRDERNNPRSPWPDFLRKLEVGDSFTMCYPTVRNVLTIAKWLDIPLVYDELPKHPEDRMARLRVWRVKFEPDYSI